MFKHILIVTLLVCFSTSSFAVDDKNILEIKRLQSMVTVINLELKSDLDQVMMLQQAAKINSSVPLQLQGRSPDPLSYDDLQSSKRLAIQRETSINMRLDAILVRSHELDVKKQLLLDRMMELSMLPIAVDVKSSR